MPLAIGGDRLVHCVADTGDDGTTDCPVEVEGNVVAHGTDTEDNWRIRDGGRGRAGILGVGGIFCRGSACVMCRICRSSTDSQGEDEGETDGGGIHYDTRLRRNTEKPIALEIGDLNRNEESEQLFLPYVLADILVAAALCL